jgi:hypothetical protein
MEIKINTITSMPVKSQIMRISCAYWRDGSGRLAGSCERDGLVPRAGPGVGSGSIAATSRKISWTARKTESMDWSATMWSMIAPYD